MGFGDNTNKSAGRYYEHLHKHIHANHLSEFNEKATSIMEKMEGCRFDR